MTKYDEEKAAWEKQQDELDTLYPGRKRQPFPSNISYGSMAFTLFLLIGGMTAVIYQYHGNFDWLF